MIPPLPRPLLDLPPDHLASVLVLASAAWLTMTAVAVWQLWRGR